MPVADIITKKIGSELLESLYLGVKTGMRRGVQDYRASIKSGDPKEAELAVASIERAVDMPNRARARMELALTTLGPKVLAGVQAANSTVTIPEISDALTVLENYAMGLVNHVKNDAWTWDQVADDIDVNIELELTQWVFPFPDGYLDVWGK